MNADKIIGSLFFRVAALQALAFAAGLWFTAVYFVPDALYTTSSGRVFHVFAAPAFLARVFLVYLFLLPVTYGAARLLRLLTGAPRIR